MNLLVTDYDNTLELHYENVDSKSILDRNIKAIKKFMEKNCICIATGRHFDAIFKTLKEYNVPFNYLCANNGAELYDANYNLLYSLPIEQSDIKFLETLNQEVFFRKTYKTPIIISANLYLYDLQEFENTKEILNEGLKFCAVEYKYPKIKITNKLCNKLNIINIISDLEGIDDKNIYTIGDDVNDIQMILRYNGYSLLTAKDEVKKSAIKLYNELNELIDEIDNNI